MPDRPERRHSLTRASDAPRARCATAPRGRDDERRVRQVPQRPPEGLRLRLLARRLRRRADEERQARSRARRPSASRCPSARAVRITLSRAEAGPPLRRRAVRSPEAQLAQAQGLHASTAVAAPDHAPAAQGGHGGDRLQRAPAWPRAARRALPRHDHGHRGAATTAASPRRPASAIGAVAAHGAAGADRRPPSLRARPRGASAQGRAARARRRCPAWPPPSRPSPRPRRAR